jgi:hypothetical protein
MPLWAEILVPLLTGLVALGGGILGTYLSGRLERERERRRLLAETARPFAEKVGGAWDSLVYAMTFADEAANAEMKQAAQAASHLAGEAGVLLATVRLFFSPEIARNAEQALADVKATSIYLQRAAAHPDGDGAELRRARRAYRRAGKRQSRFYKHAGAAIWQARLGPRLSLASPRMRWLGARRR